jgi:hypothetical protein
MCLPRQDLDSNGQGAIHATCLIIESLGVRLPGSAPSFRARNYDFSAPFCSKKGLPEETSPPSDLTAYDNGSRDEQVH